jgi:hypothetical protein
LEEERFQNRRAFFVQPHIGRDAGNALGMTRRVNRNFDQAFRGENWKRDHALLFEHPNR